MYRFFVKLDTIQRVKDFVKVTEKIPSNVYLQRNEYVVDAKSIMGIFSLDLSKVCCLIIEDEISDELLEELKYFIIE